MPYLRTQFSVHFGYVNLTPIVYGIAGDPVPILKKAENELLSQFGLRSLSRFDQFYRFESDAFRGKIYLWQNYMVLRGLHRYYPDVPEVKLFY